MIRGGFLFYKMLVVMNPPLSPEQKRVKEAYKLTLTPAVLLAILGMVVASVICNLLLRTLGVKGGVPGSIGGVFFFVGYALAHLWALRKIRRAGFSLEASQTEVVPRQIIAENLGTINWRYPKTLLGSFGFIAFYLLMSAGCWWLLTRFPDSSNFNKALEVLGLGTFSYAALTKIIFFHSPYVKMDDEGIAALPDFGWRRRVLWMDVASCEINHSYNFLGEGPFRNFIFKSDAGKVLLRLDNLSFLCLSRDESAEIEQEIKRRLRGVNEVEAS